MCDPPSAVFVFDLQICVPSCCAGVHTESSTCGCTHLSADAEWLVLRDVLPSNQLPDEDTVTPDVCLDGGTLVAHNLSQGHTNSQLWNLSE